MKTKVKWISARGKYEITRYEMTQASVPYRGTDGKVYADHMITATRIVGYAGDVAVIGVTVSGTHPMTRANYRELLARKIQDEGGSWIGRTHATENARVDAVINHSSEASHAYYAGVPHPSNY